MAYTPKSKRLAKGDSLKSSSLNNLSSNKKIDDILALSKGLNLSESDILKLQSDVVSINTSITSLQTSKQDLLVSGVNIKTINGNSLLGSGNLVISISSVTWGTITGTLSSQTDLQTALNAKQATLVSGTNIKTVNSTSLLGSGDVAVGLNYERRSAFVNPYQYSGTAVVGTAESSATWTIKRINFTTPGSPITQVAVGAWTNRLSLIYI